MFQRCKVCGRDFVARSRHYELCSDGCRKKKGNRLEQLYDAAYYYWYNRLRKLRREKAANPEKAAAVGEAFKAFRKEAVKRKGEVKCGKMKLNDFSSWLIEQQNEFDRLMDG